MTTNARRHDARLDEPTLDDTSLDDTSLDDTVEYPYLPVAADHSVGPALPWERTPAEAFRSIPRAFRDHRRAAGIVGAVIGVILLSGATAWAVSAGVSSGAPAAVAAAPASDTGTGLAPGGVGADATRAIARGRITAIDGSTWTVLSAAGKSLVVTITSGTRFGTAKVPAAAADFAVGSAVVVVGDRSAGRITAARVVERRTGPVRSPGTGSPGPTPPGGVALPGPAPPGGVTSPGTTS